MENNNVQFLLDNARKGLKAIHCCRAGMKQDCLSCPYNKPENNPYCYDKMRVRIINDYENYIKILEALLNEKSCC